MIKNIFKGCGVAALLCLTGCELDYAPENTLVDEGIYKYEKTTEAALMGAYVRFNAFVAGAPDNQNYYANTGTTFLCADLGTDNLSAQDDATDFLAIEKAEYTSTQHEQNGTLYNLWNKGYNAIDMANNIIRGIEEYGAYTPAMMAQHTAEAKFIRAYCYFEMLLMFGDQALLGQDDKPGVLIRLTPFDGYVPGETVSRETNAGVWRRILSDLEDNLTDLPEAVPAIDERIRANQAAAKALLSRVYLYKGTYNNNQEDLGKAKQYAGEVLANSSYSCSTQRSEYLNTLFPYNYSTTSDYAPDPSARSNELIFFQPSRMSTDKYPSGLGLYVNKRSIYVPAAMKDLYLNGDVRGFSDERANGTEGQYQGLIAKGYGDERPTQLTTLKYDNWNGYSDVPYLRLTEMKLNYAEADVRTSGTITTDALKYLNEVRQRVFTSEYKPALYEAADFASVDDFLKTMLEERRRELAYEGHHRWDLMRTNNLLGDKKLGALPQNKWNLPIPEFEVRITEGMVEQNEGYK